MTYVTPCQDPANNPDDWFISKDGKQYDDDPIVDCAGDPIDALHPRPDSEGVDITLECQAEATRAALTRRRHARDECHTNCRFRLQCLGVALEVPTPATHGTWGGYYQEQLVQIRKTRDARQKRRESHDADVDGDE